MYLICGRIFHFQLVSFKQNQRVGPIRVVPPPLAAARPTGGYAVHRPPPPPPPRGGAPPSIELEDRSFVMVIERGTPSQPEGPIRLILALVLPGGLPFHPHPPSWHMECREGFPSKYISRTKSMGFLGVS